MFTCAELQQIPKQGALTFEKELGDISPSQMCLANSSHPIEWLCLRTGDEQGNVLLQVLLPLGCQIHETLNV